MSTSSLTPTLKFPGQPGSQGRGATCPQGVQGCPAETRGSLQASTGKLHTGLWPPVPSWTRSHTDTALAPGPVHASRLQLSVAKDATPRAHLTPQRLVHRPHAHHGPPLSASGTVCFCPEAGHLLSISTSFLVATLRCHLERPLLASFSWSRQLDAGCWGLPLPAR